MLILETDIHTAWMRVILERPSHILASRAFGARGETCIAFAPYGLGRLRLSAWIST